METYEIILRGSVVVISATIVYPYVLKKYQSKFYAWGLSGFLVAAAFVPEQSKSIAYVAATAAALIGTEYISNKAPATR
mgnify:CR=1 FL=1